MYNNVGAKIKKLADVLLGLGVIISLIAGFIIFCFGANSKNIVISIIGITIAIVGFILAWFSSLFMAGFGELIDKTSKQYELSCLQAQLSAGLIENSEYVDKLTELGKVEATADKST